MYHKTDHSLNRQIAELNKVKIDLSFKKLFFTILGYVALIPAVTYLTIVTRAEFILYVYLAPLFPIICITYLIFTGKLKWLIKIAHKFKVLSSKFPD